MRLFTLSILLMILFGGCARKTYVPLVRTQQITDTITRTVADSAVLQALFECDSVGRVRLRELQSYKGLEAAQEVDFRDGKLKVETRWRTQYIDRFREVRDTVTVVEYRTEIKEVRHVPTFFWWCFAIALLALLRVAWWVVNKIR